LSIYFQEGEKPDSTSQHGLIRWKGKRVRGREFSTLGSLFIALAHRLCNPAPFITV